MSDSAGITSLSAGTDEFDEQFPERVQPLGGLWPVRERGRREDEKYSAGEQVGQCIDHGFGPPFDPYAGLPSRLTGPA